MKLQKSYRYPPVGLLDAPVAQKDGTVSRIVEVGLTYAGLENGERVYFANMEKPDRDDEMYVVWR